jgi:two-component system response regulator HydG
MADNASVLIVDDNESLCRTMSLVLRRKGYETATAKDGIEAIEQAIARHFDVILMDIKMPRLHGVEAFRRIKQHRPDTLVLLMTAYSVDETVQQALAEGAYGVIRKPFDVDRVIGLIESARKAATKAVILLVDDQAGACTTFKNILARRGCEVTIAHSGEEAVELARQQVHDIVFIDMKLPAMDGFQTYLAIKQVNPRAVVIVMTAYREEMAQRVREALDACAYTCLYKPLDMEHVLMMVDELWEQRQRDGNGG